MIAGKNIAKLINGLYCITAEEYSLGRKNVLVVKEMVDNGVKIIQYRDKEKKKLEKYKECLVIRELTAKNDVTFIVNDDVDLALAVSADGVHVGQDDLPCRTVKEIAGDKLIVGVSTHSPDQAKKAVSDGADYIGVGPIFPTKTKKDVCPAVGLEYLDYVVKNIKIPFVAIGGIKLHNINEVLAHGAKCVAMVTEIVSADDIRERIRKTLSIFPE